MSKAGRLSKCSGCDGVGWLAHVDGRVDCDVCNGAGRVMIAANDNGRATSPRDAARDIAALLRSGHVEAGGALPIQQRVQTSGRGDPQLPRWSAEGERAQRILGRGYAEGGEARRCALALWLIHAEHVEPLALGLGVLLSTDHARRAGWLSELRREADSAIGAARRMREEHARALAAAKVAAKKGKAA